MTVRNTVDIVWRSSRQRWCVEGGNGTSVVLGVHSVHDSREEALKEALEVASDFDADVRILNEKDEKYPDLPDDSNARVNR